MRLNGKTKNGDGSFRRSLPAFCGAFVVALVAGLVLGFVADRYNQGLSILVVPTGLLAGLTLLVFGAPRSPAYMLLAVLCVLPGLGLYAWICSSGTSEWVAEERLTDEAELDQLIWSIKLVQLVGERQIPVWDYESAPQEVKDDAWRIVAGMTRREKLALCDDKYGECLGKDTIPQGFTRKYVTPVMWASLTLLCTVSPLAFGSRCDNGE